MSKDRELRYHTRKRIGAAAQVLDALLELTSETDYPPTMDEIAKRTKLCKSTVYSHVETLELHGLITRRPNLPRTLVATPGGVLAGYTLGRDEE